MEVEGYRLEGRTVERSCVGTLAGWKVGTFEWRGGEIPRCARNDRCGGLVLCVMRGLGRHPGQGRRQRRPWERRWWTRVVRE